MIGIQLDGRGARRVARLLALALVFWAGYCARRAGAAPTGSAPALGAEFDSLEARARRGALAWQDTAAQLEFIRRVAVSRTWRTP